MKITDQFLPEDQYNKVQYPKKQIYLHHTAGNHRPDMVGLYWSKDNIGKIATAYAIGGISTSGDKNYDGLVYRFFEDKYWAYHLGLKTSQNLPLNKGSIGIEICNYGPLKLIDGKYYNYVKREVPESMSYKTEAKFKGFDFYHKYTDEQLKSTKELVLKIANEHNIQIKKHWDLKSFDISQDALNGKPGLYTHVNVRLDKFDCSPQPELIDMLNSL